MEWITAQQAAEKWETSVRTVQNLCKEGRIPGVERWGRTWMIPAGTKRPVDRRGKAVKQSRGGAELKMTRQSPLILMTDFHLKQEKQMHNPWLDVLMKAWLAYGHGKIDLAVELAKQLCLVQADFYGDISIGLVLAACALWKGDTSLWIEGRKRILQAEGENPNDYAIRQLWLATTDEGLLDNSQLPGWFQKGQFEMLPKDSLPGAGYYYAKHLYVSARDLATGKSTFPETKGLGLMRMMPYLTEPMIAQAKNGKLSFLETCLRCLCAEAYYDLGDMENTVRHLDAALGWAVPNEMYGILAEFRVLFGNLMDERAARIDLHAVKHIRILQKEMMNGFSKISHELRNNRIATTLSGREQEIAKLAALGLSNPEIAERLHISVNSVKSMIAAIMNKTGAQKRSEFASYIL